MKGPTTRKLVTLRGVISLFVSVTPEPQGKDCGTINIPGAHDAWLNVRVLVFDRPVIDASWHLV